MAGGILCIAFDGWRGGAERGVEYMDTQFAKKGAWPENVLIRDYFIKLLSILWSEEDYLIVC